MWEAVDTIRSITVVKRILCTALMLVSMVLEKYACILIGWKRSSATGLSETSRLHLTALFLYILSINEYETFVSTTILGLTSSNTQCEATIQLNEWRINVTTRKHLHPRMLYSVAILCSSYFVHKLRKRNIKTKIAPASNILCFCLHFYQRIQIHLPKFV